MIEMLATAAVFALAQDSVDWPAGEEREVDRGVHMQVVAANRGWRIWRVRTEDGIACRAAKSAVGRASPVPMGVSSKLRGSDFLEIWQTDWGTWNYGWNGENPAGLVIRYRTPSADFWIETGGARFDASVIGEQEIELDIRPKPAVLFMGHGPLPTTFNLAGLAWAQREVSRCNATGAFGVFIPATDDIDVEE